MKKIAILVMAAFAMNATMAQGKMEKTVEVGGALMYPSKNIVENAVNSKDHTTLVAAVKAADLVGTLQSAGYTYRAVGMIVGMITRNLYVFPRCVFVVWTWAQLTSLCRVSLCLRCSTRVCCLQQGLMGLGANYRTGMVLE